MKSLKEYIISERDAAPKVDMSNKTQKDVYSVFVDGVMDMFFYTKEEADEHVDMLKKNGGEDLNIEVKKSQALVNERFVSSAEKDKEEKNIKLKLMKSSGNGDYTEEEFDKALKKRGERYYWDHATGIKYSEAYRKMLAWHEGRRGFNIKSAGVDKLRMNWTICMINKFYEKAEIIQNRCKELGLSLQLDEDGRFA